MRQHFGLIIIFLTVFIFDIAGNALGGNLRLGLVALACLLSVLTPPDRHLVPTGITISIVFSIIYGLVTGINVGAVAIIAGLTTLILSSLTWRNLFSRSFLASLVLFNLWVLICRAQGIYLDYLPVVVVNSVVAGGLSLVIAYVLSYRTQRHAFK